MTTIDCVHSGPQNFQEMKGFMAIDQGYEQEDEHFFCDYLVADRQLEYV